VQYSREIAEYVKQFKLDELLQQPVASNELGVFDTVNPDMTNPYLPDWDDLVRLHKIIRQRKATTILEFGCGYSTVVMAHALMLNNLEFGDFVRANLRRGNPFELHSVDDMPQFVEITRGRIPAELAPFVTMSVTSVNMATFNDRICTEYAAVPNICPDFVYLDAPSQHSAQGSINGISTAHPDRLPMSADLLKMEHFLLPGTLILVDGRTANARFLKANFQRNWIHVHDTVSDIHTFELVESPLGSLNAKQIEFCLGSKWLQRARKN
jgi:hypothetical protein